MTAPTAAKRGKDHARPIRRHDPQALRRVIDRLIAQHPKVLTTADTLPIPTRRADR